MIPLFELRNRKQFSWYYRFPYYIRNLVLILNMALILFIIYMVDFEQEAISYLTIYRVLSGIHATSFTYLQSRVSRQLNIRDRKGKVKWLNKTASPQQFFSECLRVNAVCYFPKMAEDWPAYESWQSS